MFSYFEFRCTIYQSQFNFYNLYSFHILNCSFCFSAAPDSSISKHISGRHYNPIQFRSGISTVGVLQSRVCCSVEDLQQLLFSSDDITTTVGIGPTLLSQEDQEFYEKVVSVTQGDVLRIAVETAAQNSKEWQMQRAIRITASSCYSLYTYSKNENPNWERKI